MEDSVMDLLHWAALLAAFLGVLLILLLVSFLAALAMGLGLSAVLSVVDWVVWRLLRLVPPWRHRQQP